jgi:hypothetical protein
MQSFASEIATSLPRPLSLPKEFVAALDWMENNNAIGQMRGGGRFGMTDPAYVAMQGGCCVHFHACDPTVVNAWTGSNAPDLDRLAPIVQTGGDGSMAALWKDDAGECQIVHLGSGSGSISVGTFTRTPLDFLRLLAVGYDEICWPDSYDVLPIDAAYDRDRYLPPARFRSWLSSTYGVTIPTTAAALVLPMADIGEDSDDPFCRWLSQRIG